MDTFNLDTLPRFHPCSPRPAHPMRTSIDSFLVEMLHSEQVDADECSYWEHPIAGRLRCTNCTDGARMVVHRFGGRIMGYHCKDGDKRVGAIAGGHDFALIEERWLVDYWARYVSEDEPFAVYDLCNALDSLDVVAKYGPANQWEEIPL